MPGGGLTAGPGIRGRRRAQKAGDSRCSFSCAVAHPVTQENGIHSECRQQVGPDGTFCICSNCRSRLAAGTYLDFRSSGI